jgi:membrane fusion protein, heavy metal efflux system
MNHTEVDAHVPLPHPSPRTGSRWLAWTIVGLGILLVPIIIGVRWWWRTADSVAPAPPADSGAVILTLAAQRDAGVALAAGKTVTRSARFEAPGSLSLDETRTARIGSVVEGRIVAMFAEVGDRVSSGAVLATMHSQIVHSAWADYRKAVADRRRRATELTYAQQMEARAQRLYNDKALPLQEVQRTAVDRVAAEEAFNTAQTEVRRAEESLEHLGITNGEDPSGESGEVIPIKTPLAGAVLEKSVTVGTTVAASTPVFVVSDLSTLWALAAVDETKLPLMQIGRAVEIRVAAYPDEIFPGTIIFVADTFDPKTRRVTVRCRVPNQSGRLKPQMYATLSISEGEPRSAIVVDARAVQLLDGKPVVFVAENNEKFTPRAVTVGPTQDGWSEILTGVQPGEQVVTSGSFLLKSELKKSATAEE